MVQGVLRQVEVENGGDLKLIEKFVINKKDEADDVCKFFSMEKINI